MEKERQNEGKNVTEPEELIKKLREVHERKLEKEKERTEEE